MVQLLYRRRILKIHKLIVAAEDAFADQAGGLALLRLAIGIKSFLHAGAAVGAVRPFKAATQALVAMVAVTVAEAWHLIEDLGFLDRGFIGRNMGRLNKALIRQLFLGKDGRQLFSRRGSSGVERRSGQLRIALLRMSHGMP